MKILALSTALAYPYFSDAQNNYSNYSGSSGGSPHCFHVEHVICIYDIDLEPTDPEPDQPYFDNLSTVQSWWISFSLWFLNMSYSTPSTQYAEYCHSGGLLPTCTNIECGNVYLDTVGFSGAECDD